MNHQGSKSKSYSESKKRKSIQNRHVFQILAVFFRVAISVGPLSFNEKKNLSNTDTLGSTKDCVLPLLRTWKVYGVPSLNIASYGPFTNLPPFYQLPFSLNLRVHQIFWTFWGWRFRKNTKKRPVLHQKKHHQTPLGSFEFSKTQLTRKKKMKVICFGVLVECAKSSFLWNQSICILTCSNIQPENQHGTWKGPKRKRKNIDPNHQCIGFKM